MSQTNPRWWTAAIFQKIGLSEGELLKQDSKRQDRVKWKNGCNMAINFNRICFQKHAGFIPPQWARRYFFTDRTAVNINSLAIARIVVEYGFVVQHPRQIEPMEFEQKTATYLWTLFSLNDRCPTAVDVEASLAPVYHRSHAHSVHTCNIEYQSYIV